ncbi:hypothetical protein [Oligoflexus tunisiensis]|nr:hypothetical protein [Oligoflexus tunisiensis]
MNDVLLDVGNETDLYKAIRWRVRTNWYDHGKIAEDFKAVTNLPVVWT